MIKSVSLKNFMSHKELSISNLPNINIIIGKNDTGKTGILKMLYSIVKSLEIYSIKKNNSDPSFKKELADKLSDTFMPRKNGLGDLVQKGSREKLEVNVTIEGQIEKYKQPIYFAFGDRTETSISSCTEVVLPIQKNSINALFIPAKEVLTAFNDISTIRDNFYGKGFDDTYLDLIKALRIGTTRERVSQELSTVNTELESLFDGKIEQTNQQDNPFAFKRGNHSFAMQQTAEGIKKIGILSTLINNRQLGKGTVLFMDEPETTLHPDAIRKLVEMLVGLSKAGVQIILASHSYFVIKQMAICAKREKISALCWNLEKTAENTLSYSFNDLIDGVLPSNSIIEETLKMYDEEIETDFKN